MINMAFLVKWLGQGGFELSDGKVTVFLDPYLSDMVEKHEKIKRLVTAPIQPAEAHPNLYIITHDHMDHLDADAIALMSTEGIRFAAPDSCVAPIIALGVKEKDILRFNREDTFFFSDFTFTAVYAKHTPDSIGIVIQNDGLTVYFTGDSEFTEDVGKGITCDILFTCINGKWGNMNIDEALLLAVRVSAKIGVPNHYGMFAENTADPVPFIEGLEQIGKKGYRMKHGEFFDLSSL